MKKMPPPGKMPPNGNGRSPHNGRAEALSHGERIAQLEVRMENVVTKADLAEFKGEMKTEMAELRIEMADFRAEMMGMLNKMLRWIIGSMGVMIISFLGLLATVIFRLF